MRKYMIETITTTMKMGLSICLFLIMGSCSKGEATPGGSSTDMVPNGAVGNRGPGPSSGDSVDAPTGTYVTQSGYATLLFSSGFEKGVTITDPERDTEYPSSLFFQHLKGEDEGFSWPIKVFNPKHQTRFFMLVKNGDQTLPYVYNIKEYMENDLLTVTGWDGKQTRTLYQSLLKPGGSISQNWVYWHPGEPVKRLYLRYRMKYPEKEDFIKAFPEDRSGWTAVFFYKTAHTDYRIEPTIVHKDGELYWDCGGSGQPNGGGTPYVYYWRAENHDVPVPLGKWFTLEIYINVSAGDNGRFYMTVDGQVVYDYHGPTKKKYDIDRIAMYGCYGRQRPHKHWVDDVEIWNNLPCAAPPCVVKQK